ncbi:MAG: mechanosensitive ion channel family protein [Candidatus Bathyarchaeia archaeon]|jgi:small-conductance mechanosensitive channel
MMKRLESQGKLSAELSDLAGALLRMIIWLAAAFFVLAEVLVTLGLQEMLLQSISSFLTANAGRIGVMIVIIVVGYVALRIFRIVFAEYKRRTKLHPFTVDLFQNLARYLVYAIVAVLLLTNVLVMAGLQTLAGTMVTLFTVFIGLVVSFAATGSIGNALSGLVIMSWRPYKDGDRVEVAGGTYGDVVEVDVMFTKIRTIKDEIVHVPNNQVLGNKIVNYSALPKVIVHQQITISYDVSRKLVEELLLEAAQRSEGLLAEPKPFLLVRDLDNNYVAYEINAYTDKPNRLVAIYSNLMENILDRFDQAGVEILSPQYVALRRSTPTLKRGRRKTTGNRRLAPQNQSA